MYVQSIINHNLIIQFPSNDVIKTFYLVLCLPIINGATIKIREKILTWCRSIMNNVILPSEVYFLCNSAWTLTHFHNLCSMFTFWSMECWPQMTLISFCEMVKKNINARMTSSIIFVRHHNAPTLLWNWSPIGEKVSTYILFGMCR
jgi:hypothetical protein